MKHIEIKSYRDSTTLYAGHFPDVKSCLETAILDGAKLHYADLRSLNLTNANMDEGDLFSARFDFSNLTGANLSECQLSEAVFTNASLYNTCLAHSDMRHGDFVGSSFGATDITEADLRSSRFSNLSCFTLNFTTAKTIEGAFYVDHNGQILNMGKPPVVVMGLDQMPLVFLDQHTLLGTHTRRKTWRHEEILSFQNETRA